MGAPLLTRQRIADRAAVHLAAAARRPGRRGRLLADLLRSGSCVVDDRAANAGTDMARRWANVLRFMFGLLFEIPRVRTARRPSGQRP